MTSPLYKPYRALRCLPLILAGSFLAACSESGFQPPVPTDVEVESGPGGSVAPAGSLTLSVRVAAQGGGPASGVVVSWSVVAGGGSLSSAESTTDETGVARVGWTSDGTAGAVVVRAAIPGVSPIEISLEVTAGPPAEIDLSPSEITLHTVGETLNLVGSVLDSFGNTVSVELDWSVDDAEVASVSEGGVVRAEGPGETRVRVRFGEVEAAASVKVDLMAASAEITPAELAFSAVGDTLHTSFTAFDAGGYAFGPEQDLVKWFSEDQTIATVDSRGVVTAAGAGSTEVVAHFQGTAGTLAVVVAPEVHTMTLRPETLFLGALGDQEEISLTARDRNGEPLDGSALDPSWASSDESVATVEEGVVTARGNGSAEIRVEVGGVSASITAHVGQEVSTLKIHPSAVSFEALGSSQSVRIEAYDSGGSLIDPEHYTVAWGSSDEGVFTVSGGSELTSVGVGTAEFIAVGGASAIATVSVSQVPASVQIQPAELSFTAIGLTAAVEGTVHDANGHEIPALGGSLFWASSDPGVAAVSSSGTVEATGAGEASITATLGSVSSSIDVEVAQVPASITVDPDSLAFAALGHSAVITATARDSSGLVIPLPAEAFIWTSGDGTVATVDSEGEVSAAGVGATTVSAEFGGVSASATVVVSQVPASVSVSGPGSALTAPGATAQLSASAQDAMGQVIPLTNGDFIWASADDGVATVSGTGLVSAVADGTVTISASVDGVVGTVGVEVEIAAYSLTVIRTGSGAGSVASSPAGIDCGPDCSSDFATGTMVTLTASPSAGSVFVGWSGGGCSGTGTCEVEVDSDITVSAGFGPEPAPVEGVYDLMGLTPGAQFNVADRVIGFRFTVEESIEIRHLRAGHFPQGISIPVWVHDLTAGVDVASADLLTGPDTWTAAELAEPLVLQPGTYVLTGRAASAGATFGVSLPTALEGIVVEFTCHTIAVPVAHACVPGASIATGLFYGTFDFTYRRLP